MILAGDRPTRADRQAADRRWGTWAVLGRLRRGTLLRALQRAADDLVRFSAGGPFLASTSWGKDSALLLAAFSLALPRLESRAWVFHGRFEPVANPDMPAAREAGLECWPELRALYLEVVFHVPFIGGRWDEAAAEPEDMPPELGLVGANRRATGIRGAESRDRLTRQRVWGTTTPNTCAPLTYLADDEAYALIALLDLPLPQSYACNYGGLLAQRSIRFDSLAGPEGVGHGRAAWERSYYGRELDALAAKPQSR